MDRLLRRKEVQHLTGLTTSLLYKLVREGKFPRQVKISGTNAVAWSAHSVNEWIKQQLANVPVDSGWLTGSAAVDALGREAAPGDAK